MSQFDPRVSGAAPVSRVEAVDASTLFLVTALRVFGTSREHEFWNTYSSLSEICHAASTQSVFENLMHFITNAARRPLMKHDGACNCIGADEASFTQFERIAAEGEP